ncbi:hypothetical protein ABTZ03_18165 [Kitasatospora sp. NPDC096077]|uniref:hypothetical protein n=1 Tax=Kitasatospora sp. NPDC096077 TaxID=3155544 RepID=UPI0033313DBC
MLLKQGDTVLGTITIDDLDMPWWHGHFRPTPAFEPIRPFFDATRRAFKAADDRTIGAALGAIKSLALVIEPEDGTEPITAFLLHIEGDRMRLRH